MQLTPAPHLRTGAINKHVSIRSFTVIGYDSVHLPRMDGGCVIVAERKQAAGRLWCFSPATDAQW